VVRGPVGEEPLVDERAVVVVREVLGDRVEGPLQEVRVVGPAGGQVGVDEIRGCVVADRVPVLPRLVEPQRVRVRAQHDGVDVRVVAATLVVAEVVLEEADRPVDIAGDPPVTGHAEGLRRAGERVDLLVHRNGVVVVVELRGEQLLLGFPFDLDAVVPVHDVVVGVDRAHVVTQVLGTPFGDLQVLVLAGEHVRRRHAVHHPRDGVGLLDVAVGLVAAEPDDGPVVPVVDQAGAELRPPVELRELVHLVGPPAGLLEVVPADVAPEKDQALGLVGVTAALRVEHAVGEQVPPGCEELADQSAGVGVRLTKVPHHLGGRITGQGHVESPAVCGLECEHTAAAVVFNDVARNRVHEREISGIRHCATSS